MGNLVKTLISKKSGFYDFSLTAGYAPNNTNSKTPHYHPRSLIYILDYIILPPYKTVYWNLMGTILNCPANKKLKGTKQKGRLKRTTQRNTMYELNKSFSNNKLFILCLKLQA